MQPFLRVLGRLSQRSWLALGVFLIATGVLLFASTAGEYPLFFTYSGTRSLKLLSLFLAFYGLIFSLFGYLKGDPSKLKIGEFSVNATATPSGSVEDLSLEVQGAAVTNRGEGRVKFGPLQAAGEAEALSSPLDPREVRIGALFDANQARLRNEITALGSRSNLNLAVGVSVTIAATGLLIYLVTRLHPDFDKLAPVLNFYIPRVTTIVLIETFAYFFLGLYRANLAEIKFYQGERTTLAALEIAWRASLWPELSESTAVVVKQLAATDRNSLSSTGNLTTDKSELLELLKSVSTIAVESLKKKGEH